MSASKAVYRPNQTPMVSQNPATVAVCHPALTYTSQITVAYRMIRYGRRLTNRIMPPHRSTPEGRI